MRRLRSWLSYGNVTATVAVFLAMSGAAVAVTTAPTNSVTSSSIKDGQVKTPDVGAGAVTTPKIAANAVRSGKVADGGLNGLDVRDGSLAGSDLAADSVTGPKIAHESVSSGKISDDAVGFEELADDSVYGPEIGARAVDSDDLATDSVGARQLHDDVIPVVGEARNVAAGEAHNAVVYCPANTQLIAGGYAWQNDGPTSITFSTPNELNPDYSWVVRGRVPTGSPSNNLFAWANCLDT